MNLNEKRVTEIFLGLILIITLIILILSFTNVSGTNSQNNQQATPATSTNSYNTNSYNTYIIYEDYPTKYYQQDDKNYLDYFSRKQTKTITGILGNDINRYYVYVKNKDDEPGYFKVRFYFTDNYGKTISMSKTKYIRSGEEEQFFYQDIQNKYYTWQYDVVPPKY